MANTAAAKRRSTQSPDVKPNDPTVAGHLSAVGLNRPKGPPKITATWDATRLTTILMTAPGSVFLLFSVSICFYVFRSLENTIWMTWVSYPSWTQDDTRFDTYSQNQESPSRLSLQRNWFRWLHTPCRKTYCDLEQEMRAFPDHCGCTVAWLAYRRLLTVVHYRTNMYKHSCFECVSTNKLPPFLFEHKTPDFCAQQCNHLTWRWWMWNLQYCGEVV